MIQIEDILLLHHLSIEDFGGSHGIRDEQMLASAISRPFQTFDSKELYDTPIKKAAALGESLAINHPFIDGNKRIALLGMLATLKTFGIEINVKQDVLYQFVIDISTGTIKYDDIVCFLEQNQK